MAGAERDGDEALEERVTLRLTREQKEGMLAVAASMGVEHSALLRTMSLQEIMERATRIRAALKV